MEQLQRDSDAAVVAATGFLDPLEVFFELAARREGSAVDPLQHRVVLVTAPVGARDLEQLPRADLVAALDVGPAAQIREVAVAEDGDLLAFGDVVETGELEVFAQVPEQRPGLLARHHLAREARVLGDDRAHLLLDPLEVLGREGALHQKVVLELLGMIAAPDVDLGLGEQALHCIGHDVFGGVSDDLAGRRVAVGHDLEGDVLRERLAQVDEAAGDAAGERSASEPRTDPLGNGEDRRALGDRQRLAVRQANADLGHGRGRFILSMSSKPVSRSGPGPRRSRSCRIGIW